MKKLLLLLVAVIATSFTSFAQVGIGTTTPDASAALDITSTTQGFLPPRLTEAQMTTLQSTAIEGLMVYCTDCVPKTLYVFDAFNFVSTSNNTPSGLSSTDVYSTTGETWMDRNLGATMVSNQPKSAFASNALYTESQEDSFGDLYQWGRKTDGHQIRTSNIASGPVASGSEGANFITSSGDWLNPRDDARWAATKTANDPCPSGFRVPTETEFAAELASWGAAYPTSEDAYNSVLKLPAAGLRHDSNGTLGSLGSSGDYWSSSVSGLNARYLYFTSTAGVMITNSRALGFSVRCIKD